MKKKLIKDAACAMILSLIFLPCLAFAQAPEQTVTEEADEDLPIYKIAEELGLSSEQKEKLKEQRFQARYSMIENRNKIRLKELELRHELEEEAINHEAINKIVAELKQLHGATIEQRVNSILKMREILSPEQFEKLQSLGKQRMAEKAQEQKSRFPFFRRGAKEDRR
jgi:Spy/CpxP family protein refolding chaperone